MSRADDKREDQSSLLSCFIKGVFKAVTDQNADHV